MPIYYVDGDPFLSGQQTLAFGYNARARTENTPLALVLQHRYPAAMASYRKLCHKGRLKAGDLWVWHETRPKLALMVVRESSVGATRPRYVDAAALRIARDHTLEGIHSVAIAPLGRDLEMASVCEALELLLARVAIPVVVYKTYLPGVRADESADGPKPQ